MEEEFLKALEKNDITRAEDILEDMKEKLPRTRFLYLEGLLHEKMGDLEEALKKFDMALVLHLSDHTLWMAKARTLLELESLDMAKRAAERACRLKNEDPDAHLLDLDLGSNEKNFKAWAWTDNNGHLSSKAYLELAKRIVHEAEL